MVKFRMGVILLMMNRRMIVQRMISVLPDFLYYSAIGTVKKERDVLFFARICVFPRGNMRFTVIQAGFYYFKTSNKSKKWA